MPPDDKQQTVDWQNDPDFHALPLAEKHKVLLQVDPDYKGLPAKEQAKALDAIHYGTLGQISGTGSLTQGLGKSVVETLKSQLPSLTYSGILGATKGAVGLPTPEHVINAWEETKAGYQRGGLPEALAAGAAAASPFAVSGSQMAEAAKQGESGKILGQAAVPAAEAALAYAAPKIGRVAGKVRGAIGESIHTPEGTLKTGPELASRAAGGLGGYFAGEALGGGNLLGEYVGAGAGAKYAPKVVSKLFPPRTVTPPPPVESPASILEERQHRMAAYAEMQEDFANRAKQQQKDLANRLVDAEKARQKEITDWAKLDKVSQEDHQAFADRMSEIEAERQSTLADMERLKEQHAASLNARKGAKPATAPPPPGPFAGMTSTAAPIGSAELPAIPQGQPVQRPGGMTPPPTPGPATIRIGTGVGSEGIGAQPTIGSQIEARNKSSILSRGRTLYQLGEEPDLNNPVHAKIIGDLQTRSGPALRTMAKNGDRFAAFVLRNMPRP